MITEEKADTVCHAKAEHLKLAYRLSEDELDGRASFSISIHVTDCKSGKSDSKTIRDVTSDKAEATRIFRLICEGRVTPITLEDVISDLIG